MTISGVTWGRWSVQQSDANPAKGWGPYTVLPLEELEVGDLVAPQVGHDLLGGQEVADLARLLLELLEARASTPSRSRRTRGACPRARSPRSSQYRLAT